jgi:uncharacterized protein with HEPN domain
MRPETKKYLYDVLKACEAILAFTKGRSLDEYEGDLMLRSAVERQLMIVGEALNQARHLDGEVDERVEDVRDIISLRNVIVHGYAVVENATIWGILKADVPELYEQVRIWLNA